jgi:hypothetical protein
MLALTSAGARPTLERIRKYAAELLALAPDVFLTVGSATTGPLLQATRAVPIVFVQVAEPVGARLRRNPRPAGRQHHRFHQFRIRDGKQMATPHAGLERSNERTTKQSEQLDTNRCESGDAVARWSAK